MKNIKKHKPLIETAINGSALILISAGTPMILNQKWFGFLVVGFGVGLEFFKYFGRKNKYW